MNIHSYAIILITTNVLASICLNVSGILWKYYGWEASTAAFWTLIGAGLFTFAATIISACKLSYEADEPEAERHVPFSLVFLCAWDFILALLLALFDGYIVCTGKAIVKVLDPSISLYEVRKQFGESVGTVWLIAMIMLLVNGMVAKKAVKRVIKARKIALASIQSTHEFV